MAAGLEKLSTSRLFTVVTGGLTIGENSLHPSVVQASSIYPPVPEIYNWEAWQQIRQQKDKASVAAAGIGLLIIVGGTFFSPLALAGVVPSTTALNLIQKSAQLEQVIPVLLKGFEEEGIQVFASLPVEGQQDLDLFVRFPDKTFFAIAVRSKGRSKIVYSENVEDLRIKRKAGTASNKWKPNPLQELNDQEIWLRKNRRDLFGGSSRDSRRPVVKILALWGETSVGSHPEHLYSKVGSSSYLVLRKTGTICMLQADQLVSFIRDWRIELQQRKDTS
ncbi:MAG TPA: hypothetical protein V6D18_05145 [Thermosynechococcaceae cyanobacterium]